MSLDELRDANARSILFECIAGSRAYGTTTPASDEDIRGIFALPANAYLDLERPPDQVGDERGNTVFYSLRRVFELLTLANPNILELLFMPEDCVRRTSRNAGADRAAAAFITRNAPIPTLATRCRRSRRRVGRTSGSTIRGRRRRRPRKSSATSFRGIAGRVRTMPVRPVPLSVIGWPLEEFHAARLEHARDTYRLYRYGRARAECFAATCWCASRSRRKTRHRASPACCCSTSRAGSRRWWIIRTTGRGGATAIPRAGSSRSAASSTSTRRT